MGKERSIAGLLVLIANLCVLGMSLKLYTEWFKARDQRRPNG